MPGLRRAISDSFMNDLKKAVLYPLLERVQQDQTLLLSIRNKYINIYYRGGNILRIKAKSDGSYSTSFDQKYCKSINSPIPQFPEIIRNQKDSEDCVGVLQKLKLIVDRYFSSVRRGLEREFQQLIARENNFSSKSRISGYYVTDIEYEILGARFDILTLQHLVNKRKLNFRPAIIEMKYGDNSLEGKSGIIKHLKDIDNFIKDKKKYNTLLETMKSQWV